MSNHREIKLTLGPIQYAVVCSKIQLGHRSSSLYQGDPIQAPSHLCPMPFADKLSPKHCNCYYNPNKKIGEQVKKAPEENSRHKPEY